MLFTNVYEFGVEFKNADEQPFVLRFRKRISRYESRMLEKVKGRESLSNCYQ